MGKEGSGFHLSLVARKPSRRMSLSRVRRPLGSAPAVLSRLRRLFGGLWTAKRETAVLRHKLRELQDSLRGVVEANDSERRRLEREIHDGVQQQLVAMSVKLGLGKQMLASHPDRVGAVLDDLRSDTGEVLETLRDLARRLFPPILEEKGLVGAVRAHVDRASPGTIVHDELGAARFSPETEANLFFVVRDAVSSPNANSDAGPISVRLWLESGALLFEVTNPEQGLRNAGSARPQGANMQDRLASIGGRLTIKSAPGLGTKVRGWVPLPQPLPACGGKTQDG